MISHSGEEGREVSPVSKLEFEQYLHRVNEIAERVSVPSASSQEELE